MRAVLVLSLIILASLTVIGLYDVLSPMETALISLMSTSLFLQALVL